MFFTLLLAMYSGLSIQPVPIVTCSWYGENFHGKQTASGAIFDMNEMTFASCCIPLGSICEIRNFEFSRTYIARCIDTGPYKYDDEGYAVWPLEEHPIRKLDLSRALYDSVSCRGLDSGTMLIQYRIIGYSDEGLFDYN